MAGNPITWRNINAPNFNGVQTGLAMGGDNIARGLDRLSAVAQGIQDGRQAQANAQRDSATQRLLQSIAGFTDLDNYDGFRASTLDQLNRMGNGQVDTQAVMSALEGRDNQLRTDITQRDAFNDQQLTRTERETTAPILALAETDPNRAIELARNSGIRDVQGLINQIQDIDFSNTQRNRTLLGFQRDDEQYRQTQAIPTIVDDIIAITDNENTLEQNITRYIRDNGITGNNEIVLRDLARSEYAKATALTNSEQGTLDRLGEQFANIEQQYTAERDKEKRDNGLLVKEEEVQAWSEQGSTQDAINYIADLSGEATLFEIDTPTWGLNSGVRGREYGAQYAQDAITNVQNDLQNTYKDNPDVKRLLENGLPYAVIKRAFDGTPRDSKGEWDFGAFQKNLSTVFEDYVVYQSRVQDARDFDADTAAQVEMLRQTARTNLGNAKHDINYEKRAQRRLRNR